MPEYNHQDNGQSRRTFLKRTAGALTALGLTTRATTATSSSQPPVPGTAAADNDQNLPIYAEGVLIANWERINDETFEVQTRFQSDELEDRYGKRALVYEPDQYHVKRISGKIRDGEQRRFSTRTSQVVGTAAEHATAERKIIEQADPASQIPTPSSEQPDWENDVPLYHYKTEEKAENMQSRKAPINIVFDWCNTDTVQSNMSSGEYGGEWKQPAPVGKNDRYINVNGDVQSTDGHIMNSVGVCLWTQFHMRLYDLSFENAHVAGQVHKDPCTHNKGTPVAEWKFALSRGNVRDWWSGYETPVNTEVVNVGNNDPNWDTHDGKVGYIYPAP